MEKLLTVALLQHFLLRQLHSMQIISPAYHRRNLGKLLGHLLGHFH